MAQTDTATPDKAIDADTATETKKEPKAKSTEVLTRQDKRELVQRIKTESTGIMNPVEYEQTKMLARDFVASKSLPACFSNENQVLIALLAGKEMGMSPIESLNSLYIVNGKLSIWGSARARQLRRLGYKLEYKDEGEGDNQSCTVTVTKDDETYTEKVTFKEAKDSGYTQGQSGIKVGWREGMNRRKKLRYLAVDLIIDSYISEAKGGVVGSVEIVQDAPEFNETATTKDRIENALQNRKTATEAITVSETDNETPKDDGGV